MVLCLRLNLSKFGWSETRHPIRGPNALKNLSGNLAQGLVLGGEGSPVWGSDAIDLLHFVDVLAAEGTLYELFACERKSQPHSGGEQQRQN